jgi:hypothetical protein
VIDARPSQERGRILPEATLSRNNNVLSIALVMQGIGSQQNDPNISTKPAIIETYLLVEAAKAYERVAEGKARLRAVLTM